MTFCQKCGAPVTSGQLCQRCGAKASPDWRRVPANLSHVLRKLWQNPLQATVGAMSRPAPTEGLILLGASLAMRILGDLFWWLTTPRAVFTLGAWLVSWGGFLVTVAAWTGALTFLGRRSGGRAEPAAVFNGVATAMVVPSLIAALVMASPASLRTTVGILWGAEAVVRILGLWGVARQVTPEQDGIAFRTLLYSGLLATAASTIWFAVL
jgi:uncharacterized membrane protein